MLDSLADFYYYKFMDREMSSKAKCVFIEYGIPLLIISDDLWEFIYEGKLCPTQFHTEGYISIKKSYYEKGDKYYWLSHEIGHYLVWKNEIVRDTEYPICGYPNNPIERAAFKYQFGIMKNCGLNRDESYSLIKEAMNKSSWDEDFFNDILDKVYIKKDII